MALVSGFHYGNHELTIVLRIREDKKTLLHKRGWLLGGLVSGGIGVFGGGAIPIIEIVDKGTISVRKGAKSGSTLTSDTLVQIRQ